MALADLLVLPFLVTDQLSETFNTSSWFHPTRCIEWTDSFRNFKNIFIIYWQFLGLIPIERIGEFTYFPSKTKFFLWNIFFSGKTNSGYNFERISRGIIRATTAYLRPIFAGNDFTATVGNGSVTVQILCINKGPQEEMKFIAEAVYGSISNSTQTKYIESMDSISFSYTPFDISENIGKADRITITAERFSDDEVFNQHVSILLVWACRITQTWNYTDKLSSWSFFTRTSCHHGLFLEDGCAHGKL